MKITGIVAGHRTIVISIDHHATDLSDIFIDWCVITHPPKISSDHKM